MPIEWNGTAKIRDYEVYGERRIEGYVDGAEVIAVSKTERGWKVGSSSCLPVDIIKARRCMEVMNNVLERTKEG